MIGVAVIGGGQWGPNYIRVLNGLRESRVEAVVDVDAEKLARIGSMYPGMRLERDYRAVLSDPGIDAVIVATPVETHYEVVREAILADKHVLCEKPLCKTHRESMELVELADSRDRRLMTGHIFLFNGGMMKVKELVDSGELGLIRYLSSTRSNLGPIRRDVNVAYDLCSHDIAVFNWLLQSQPEEVSATGGTFLQPGIEDLALVSMRYPGNIIASVTASWLDPKKVRQLTVVGSRRMATWDDMLPSMPVAIYDKGASASPDYASYGEFLRLSLWESEVRIPKVPAEEPLKVQTAEFLSAIANGVVRVSDGLFAAGVVRVLEAIGESMQQGGCPVRV